MEHDCKQEHNVDKLLKIVTEGNGQPSLVQQLGEISVKIDTYMARQEDLIKEFGITNKEFYEFKAKVISTDTERQSARAWKQWAIGLSIPVIIAFVGLGFNYGCKRMEILENRIDTTFWENFNNNRSLDSLEINIE
jgi:hypothetical protein